MFGVYVKREQLGTADSKSKASDIKRSPETCRFRKLRTCKLTVSVQKFNLRKNVPAPEPLDGISCVGEAKIPGLEPLTKKAARFEPTSIRRRGKPPGTKAGIASGAPADADGDRRRTNGLLGGDRVSGQLPGTFRMPLG